MNQKQSKSNVKLELLEVKKCKNKKQKQSKLNGSLNLLEAKE
jgi:hypothetical protein